MYHPSLGSIIRRLQLRYINDMPAHASSSNKTPIAKILQLLPVHICTLPLLPSPVHPRGFCAVEHTVQVRSHNITVMPYLAVQESALGPGDTGIRHQNIQAAVEVINAAVDELLHGFLATDIGDVCSTYIYSCTLPRAPKEKSAS